MQLNKNSWHYKVWSGSFDRYQGVPTSTDLCRYCHRIFWRLVLWTALASMLLWFAGTFLWLLIYKGLVLNTLITLEILGGVAVFVGLVALYTMWISGSRVKSQPKTLVGKWAQATKQGVCPMVEFTEPTPGDLKSDLH